MGKLGGEREGIKQRPWKTDGGWMGMRKERGIDEKWSEMLWRETKKYI